jgi:hypothetical protein
MVAGGQQRADGVFTAGRAVFAPVVENDLPGGGLSKAAKASTAALLLPQSGATGERGQGRCGRIEVAAAKRQNRENPVCGR